MGAALREEAYRGAFGPHGRAGEHFRKRKELCSDLESEWGTSPGSLGFNSAGFRRAAELRIRGRFPASARRAVFRHRTTGQRNPERADVSAEAPSGFSSCVVGVFGREIWVFGREI